MIFLRGSIFPGLDKSFSNRWRGHQNLIAAIFCFGGIVMVLFPLVRVYHRFFIKQWKPTSKLGRIPCKTEKEKDLTCLCNSPELLELKKDLW